MKFVRKIEKHI